MKAIFARLPLFLRLLCVHVSPDLIYASSAHAHIRARVRLVQSQVPFELTLSDRVRSSCHTELHAYIRIHIQVHVHYQ